MNHNLLSHNKLALLPAAVVVALGLVACSKLQEATPTNDSGVLATVRMSGTAADGNMNAVNDGTRAGVYDPDTNSTVGAIANKGTFEIVCDSTTPNSFAVVLPDGTEGNVNLTNQLAISSVQSIPNCN